MKILEVIKYEGDNETFIWKHPEEDFNTKSQLIVHESQEAILFKDGQALDLFGPGRYTLDTKNIPLLSKLVNIPTNGVSPFHCEVYFINKTTPLDIKWGTNSKFQVYDPKFNILLHAGANGGMGVKIEDSRKFLIKLVGTKDSFDKQTLIDYFRDLIITRVKSYLTKIMTQVSFITVNAHLDEISTAMQNTLSNDLNEFGVKLVNFFVSTIQLSETDYEKVQNALADASVVGISSKAEKGRMETLGYNWADQEMAEIAKKYADNPGSANNIVGAISQIPIALTFGEMLKETTKPLISEAFKDKESGFNNEKGVMYCPECGSKINSWAKFCSECGKSLKSEKTCPKCGNNLEDNQKFCPNCGTKRGE